MVAPLSMSPFPRPASSAGTVGGVQAACGPDAGTAGGTGATGGTCAAGATGAAGSNDTGGVDGAGGAGVGEAWAEWPDAFCVYQAGGA